ncbi:MAG: hypothetical protein ACHQ49_05990 [Elusimicrobiota bacterium]
MALIPVAVAYIDAHRADSSDAEIARALKDQGFSEQVVAAAFKEAGERRVRPVEGAKLPFARRALVVVLTVACVALFIASGLLFVRNFRRARRALEAEAPR